MTLYFLGSSAAGAMTPSYFWISRWDLLFPSWIQNVFPVCFSAWFPAAAAAPELVLYPLFLLGMSSLQSSLRLLTMHRKPLCRSLLWLLDLKGAELACVSLRHLGAHPTA